MAHDEDTIPGELEQIHKRLDEGSKRMGRLELGLRENTEATKRIEANTTDIVEAFSALTGAFKVLGWIGKVAIPLGWIAGAIAAVAAALALLKGGK